MKEGDHGWKGKRKRESHYADALTLCPPLSLPWLMVVDTQGSRRNHLIYSGSTRWNYI